MNNLLTSSIKQVIEKAEEEKRNPQNLLFTVSVEQTLQKQICRSS